MHKNIRLTPTDRKEIWRLYQTRCFTQSILAKKFRVSRQTISKVLKQCRSGIFYPKDSTNHRYKSMFYGIRRLAKVERKLELKLKAKAKQINKSYPGEMFNIDTKRLPAIKDSQLREYLFVGIDAYSRELYADILPDKSQFSSTMFLHRLVDECPYTIEIAYTDNGTEYKGTTDHEFVKACRQYKINQKFTRVARPQTNGKAERVIRTILEMWHDKTIFSSEEQRRTELRRFLNFYNTVKPHKGIDNRAFPKKCVNSLTQTSEFYLQIR
ncbi:integrase core domain-containing protein [Francisella philomiragia]